jgi:hypothetical protein
LSQLPNDFGVSSEGRLTFGEDEPVSAARRLCSLVESRLPITVESDGSEDDWSVVEPAMIVAATRHLRAIVHVEETFPSRVIGWQLVRSMFEYVTTYAWVAAESETRTKRWLKYDYEQRRKLDDDFRELGDALLDDDEERERIGGFLPDVQPMPNLVQRTEGADEGWAEALQELNEHVGGEWPEEFRSFRQLYPAIYRNGSRFTHPSSHVVDAFVGGNPPELVIGEEKPPQRDLAVIGSGILVLGLTVAVSATPTLALRLDEIVEALAG